MSCSSRGFASSPPALKVKKRASIQKASSGKDYNKCATEAFNPPIPFQDVSQYDQKRIKAGFIYADTTLQNPDQKLSPIGTRALILYRDACSHLLEFDNKEISGDEGEVQVIREEWIATIRIFEQSLQFTSCLQATRSADAQMLQDELINLQRTAFYARYGDIFAMACRKLKNEAEACKVAGWQTLQKECWTEIDRKLLREKPAYDQVLKRADAHSECPTYITISQICTRVGFDLDRMLAIIHYYAVLNELLHANLLPMIKHGHYHDLIA